MRAAPHEAQHGAHVDGDQRATEIVIPSQQVPKPIRQTEDPLPHRYIGKHMIDQMGGTFGHAAAAATGTESTPLGRERHQPILAARVAMEPREPARQATASQEVAELLFDESRQPFAIAKRRGLCTERFEVFEDNLMERTLRRSPRFVGRRGLGHAHAAKRPPCQRAIR